MQLTLVCVTPFAWQKSRRIPVQLIRDVRRQEVWRLVLALSSILAPAARSHEWQYPHYDEYLSFSEAKSLGIELRSRHVEWIDTYGTYGPKGGKVEAVEVSIEFPPMITGQPLQAAEADFACGILDGDVDAVEGEDELVFSEYRFTRIGTPECMQSAQIWAIYGLHPGETFYWISMPE